MFEKNLLQKEAELSRLSDGELQERLQGNPSWQDLAMLLKRQEIQSGAQRSIIAERNRQNPQSVLSELSAGMKSIPPAQAPPQFAGQGGYARGGIIAGYAGGRVISPLADFEEEERKRAEFLQLLRAGSLPVQDYGTQGLAQAMGINPRVVNTPLPESPGQLSPEMRKLFVSREFNQPRTVSDKFSGTATGRIVDQTTNLLDSVGRKKYKYAAPIITREPLTEHDAPTVLPGQREYGALEDTNRKAELPVASAGELGGGNLGNPFDDIIFGSGVPDGYGPPATGGGQVSKRDAIARATALFQVARGLAGTRLNPKGGLTGLTEGLVEAGGTLSNFEDQRSAEIDRAEGRDIQVAGNVVRGDLARSRVDIARIEGAQRERLAGDERSFKREEGVLNRDLEEKLMGARLEASKREEAISMARYGREQIYAQFGKSEDQMDAEYRTLLLDIFKNLGLPNPLGGLTSVGKGVTKPK